MSAGAGPLRGQGFLQGHSPCTHQCEEGLRPVLCTPPHEWAYPAHTRGSFRFTTKGTKGVPGAVPLGTPRGTD